MKEDGIEKKIYIFNYAEINFRGKRIWRLKSVDKKKLIIIVN